MSSHPLTAQHAELDTPFIEQQRRRLEALRDELLGGERRAFAADRSQTEEHPSEAAEFEDEAQDMARREVDQAVHDVNRRRIDNIERALQKIGDGTYGLSDQSGQPIPRARLEVTPEAILTLQEERQQEAGG